MSEAERLLFRIVLGGCLVHDSEDGTSCFYCCTLVVHRFPAPVEVHDADCAYVAARDYLIKQGILGEDGRPLVDLSQEPFDV